MKPLSAIPMIGIGKKYYKTIRRRLSTRSLVSSLRSRSGQEPKLIFVFPGLHGFWAGMGRGLYRNEPVFRQTVLRCDESIDKEFSPLSYFEEAKYTEGISSGASAFVLQIVIQIALSELWRSNGVEPDATTASSMGIISSCYINQALSIDNIFRIARLYVQAQRLQNIEQKLLFIRIGLDGLRTLLQECPADVSLMSEWGPSQIIVLCAVKDLNAVCSFLDRKSWAYTVCPAEHAAHTERAAARFQQAEWTKVTSASPKYEFYASFGGARYPKGVSLDGTFWYWQATKPSLGGSAVKQALLDGYNIFVIIGSNLALDQHIQESAKKLNKQILIVNSIRNDEPEEITFRQALSDLKALGLVDLADSGLLSVPSGDDRTSAAVDRVGGARARVGTPEFHGDPYPIYQSLRQAGAVHFIEPGGYWLMLDYDDVSSALKQPEVFSNMVKSDAALAGQDLAEHSIIRQSLIPYFSARGLSSLQGYLTECTQNVLKVAVKDDQFDIVSDFATPVVQSVMGHLLGLTAEEVAELQKAMGDEPYQLSRNEAAERFFAQYALADNRPADHFLSRLLPGGVSTEKVANLLTTLWITGTTSSSMLISASAQILLQHHAVRYELQYDMNLLPQFVEEVLRFEPPEQMISRITLQDAVVAGVRIPANSQVKLCIAAANRDPKHYESPDLFMLGRNPKDHLAFGAGAHYCLGAILARMETQTALRTLLEACPKMQLKEGFQIGYEQSEQFRAVSSLIVRWTGSPW